MIRAMTDVQFKLRLPADLKKHLDQAAAKNSRSLTAEVVARLSESFSDIERVMLANRQQEAALIDNEIAQTEWLMDRLGEVVDLSHPEYQKARDYLRRLTRYRQLIDGGRYWIEKARYPDQTDELAEVHDFPIGKKSSS